MKVVAALEPRTTAEVVDAVRSHDRLVVRGGCTKPALSTATDSAVAVDIAGLTGIVEYDPNEFTVTALAGTRVSEVTGLLAANGQYLPFDPPFVAAGATLGGSVASGLSGPNRYRFGGVRDFIIGVRLVDGRGDEVRGGGKVVKNAAGFDLPKLMVGSMGRLGIMTEITFKVFPAPKAWRTLTVAMQGIDDALETIMRLGSLPLDLEAVELTPTATLNVRIGGLEETLEARIQRLERAIGRGDGRPLSGDVEQAFWKELREFRWLPDEHKLVKVPVTPTRVTPLHERLDRAGATVRYGVGANVAWVAWPGEMQELDRLLSALELPGLVLIGPPESPRIGHVAGRSFAARIKSVLDPARRFSEV